MFRISSGKTVDIKCSEIVLPEFANILFGTTIEGSKVFDATHYINSIQSDKSKSVVDFYKTYAPLVDKILQAYRIKLEDAFHLNKEGHVLIDGSLCYTFIIYVEPDFWVWANERLNEIFGSGIAVSDTFLVKMASERLTTDVLNEIIEHDAGKS